VTAYTHLAFLGFMLNTVCGAFSYALPSYLAATRVPSQKKRAAYRERLELAMNRWRLIQLAGLAFGPLGLTILAALTWNAPLGSISIRISTLVSAGLLLLGLAAFAAKLAWVVGLEPDEPPDA
jgi:hypothetical protein